MSMWGRLLAVSAVAAGGLTVAACSSNGNSNSSSTTTSTTTGGTTTIPEKVPNQVSVRKDVQIINCNATQGGWSAGGTVKNTLGRSATYHITIFFTSTQAADLAYAMTSVPVNAGQTKLWSVATSFTAPSSVLCVLRGVSAS